MAYFGISRPAGRSPALKTPPDHSCWDRDALTGWLELVMETLPELYVSPGTGKLGLAECDGKEVVVQQAARAGGVPVLPGSGIKGAVRTLYELLTDSCDPHDRRYQGRCSSKSACDACHLFGCLGLSGRVSFADGVPGGDDAVSVAVEKTPVPWQPNSDRTGGDFRLYDLAEAVGVDPESGRVTPKPKEIAREVYRGRFRTRMSFRNLSPNEIGRLLLALGTGGDNAGFPLRLGGAKYDGKGAVRVLVRRLHLVEDALTRRTWEGAECEQKCTEWVAATRASEWAGVYWATLQELARALSAGGESKEGAR